VKAQKRSLEDLERIAVAYFNVSKDWFLVATRGHKWSLMAIFDQKDLGQGYFESE